jgi:hypothetical protein
MNDVIYIEILTSNGTASQSSDWYWKDKNKTMTADLAVTGGRTNTILSLSCSVTQPKPKRYVAWWMLMFPIDQDECTVDIQITYLPDLVITFISSNKVCVYNV